MHLITCDNAKAEAIKYKYLYFLIFHLAFYIDEITTAQMYCAANWKSNKKNKQIKWTNISYMAATKGILDEHK